MAMIILIYHFLVLYISKGFYLTWIPTETRVAVECTLTQTLNVVGLTEIQVILAVIVIQSGRTQQWRFHFGALICVNLWDISTLSSGASIWIPSPASLAKLAIVNCIIEGIASLRLPPEVNSGVLWVFIEASFSIRGDIGGVLVPAEWFRVTVEVSAAQIPMQP